MTRNHSLGDLVLLGSVLVLAGSLAVRMAAAFVATSSGFPDEEAMLRD